MQQLAQYIFLFLVGSSVLNFFIALAARVKTNNREFNVLILYWVALFTNFVAIAVFSKNTNQIALAFFFTSPPTLLMGKMLRDSRNIKTNWGLLIGVQAVGMAVSAFLLLETKVGFSYSLIPFILTICWPWIYPIYDSLVKSKKEAIWIEKAMALIFITGLLSHFAFAFYRLDESAAWWGWAQAIAHYQCLSVFLPLLINHRRERNERKNLELALERLSGRHSDNSASQIDELYRSLELQISQREEYSRRLFETNQQLEEEREMNEILIKTISHDLANPLTVVSAYLEMIMAGKIAPEDNQKIQNRMRLNLKSAMDMVAKIRKAIVTRQDADLLKVANVDVKLALQRTEMLYEERAREKNIKINLTSSEAPAIVLADENALVEHVFSNVLSNAVKFSFENSEINIDVRDIGDRIEIEFRDFGVGINPSRSEKTRFISTPGTCGEEGTGFGLIVMSYFLRKFDAGFKVVPHAQNHNKGTSIIISLRKVATNEAKLKMPTANFFS